MAAGGSTDELVRKILDEWNKAESAIKIAEQVNGEIINPAVYELRYAGRRFVEAISLIQSGDTERATKLLHDAHFDCCRARHDAIDAATSKISSDLTIAVKKIGASYVLDKFQNYTKLVAELNTIRALVAKSREDRDNRDKIYEAVANDNIIVIVKYYSEFQANEDVLRRSGRWSRFKTAMAVLGWLLVAAMTAWPLLKS
jgi:hypothetical protein